MSRVTCSDDEQMVNLWVGNARRAIRGRKGQAFLLELEAALLAMPVRRLIGGAFCKAGEVCLMGAALVQRLVDNGWTREAALAHVEEDSDRVEGEDGACVGRHLLGLTYVLAWELAYLNDGDEYVHRGTTPEQRWERCLGWVQERIVR